MSDFKQFLDTEENKVQPEGFYVSESTEKPTKTNKISYRALENEEEGDPQDELDKDVEDGSAEDPVAGDEDTLGSAEDEIQDDVEDPNSMVIRKVAGAHLVYKRATDEGSFEELWIYPIDNIKDDMAIRKSILSGTDIEPGKLTSEDGKQEYDMWTAGNAQMVKISGLPN